MRSACNSASTERLQQTYCAIPTSDRCNGQNNEVSSNQCYSRAIVQRADDNEEECHSIPPVLKEEETGHKRGQQFNPARDHHFLKKRLVTRGEKTIPDKIAQNPETIPDNIVRLRITKLFKIDTDSKEEQACSFQQDRQLSNCQW
eukprot:scaffold36335_cov58-Attheya_sp.AAC.2